MVKALVGVVCAVGVNSRRASYCIQKYFSLLVLLLVGIMYFLGSLSHCNNPFHITSYSSMSKFFPMGLHGHQTNQEQWLQTLNALKNFQTAKVIVYGCSI